MDIRIDKWLWTMRLFKTRSLANDEVKKGRILIDNKPLKPSKMIKVGDVIEVRKPPIIYTYRVLKISKNRLGAKFISEFMEDITPQNQIEMNELARISNKMNRPKGTGRPTKRDRRKMEDFFEPYFSDED